MSVSQTLPPLFKNQAELAEFQKSIRKVLSLTNYFLSKKAVVLGIDAGSTTSKVIMINEEAQICYQSYGNNKGKPLESVIEVIQDIYQNYLKIVILPSPVLPVMVNI